MILHYNSFPDPLPSGVWGDGGYGSERLGPLPWRCSYWRKGGGLWRWAALSFWLSRLHVCAGGGCLRNWWTCQGRRLGWVGGGGLLPYLLTNKPFILSPVDLNGCKGDYFFWIGGLLAAIFWENSTGGNLIKTGNSPPPTHPFKPPSLPPTVAPSPTGAV